MATHLEYTNYNQSTALCEQVLNYMYQMLIFKDWNYLATHRKKLATHKCVATPWLRTTDLEGCEIFQDNFWGRRQPQKFENQCIK